ICATHWAMCACRLRLGTNGRHGLVRSLECPLTAAVQIPDASRTRLMGEPLRDYRGVEYALLLPSAFDDHSIAIFNLGGINVVDLFAAVPLTDPLRRAVILNGHLSGAAPLTNRECRFVRTAPNHRTIPEGLLRGLFLGGSLLREHCRHQRKGKYRREQQREQLLQHVTTSLLTGTIVLCSTKMDESCDFSTALRSHLF